MDELELMIRVIKEILQAIVPTLHFKNLPNNLFSLIISYAFMLLNCMSALQGISENFSSWEIVTRWANDFNKHCKVHIGSYVDAHEDRVVTNTYHP